MSGSAPLERRRLQGFPADWRQLPDAQLEALHDRATPVAEPAPRDPAPRPQTAAEPGPDDLAERLAFTEAQLAAARDQIRALRATIADYEAQLAAADAELATFNAEIQALHESL